MQRVYVSKQEEEMDEDDNVKGAVALNHANAGAGLSGEDKKAELPPATLTSDDAGLSGTPLSRKKGKRR